MTVQQTTRPVVNGDLKPAKPGSVRIEDIARSGGRQIIDIRRDHEEISLTEDIKSGLQPADGGEKRLPTLLLYDEAGLKLFEDITYLEEYYLTNAEIDVLEQQAEEIARQIAPGSILLELGSGNLRKVDILLKAIDRQGKAVEYYALDLSLRELERTLAAVPKGWYNHVQCYGLHGTYDDGLQWLQDPSIREKPKTIMSLGSSIGNFSRPEAATFLKGFADNMSLNDTLIVAVDGTKDAARVYHAYNDREGTTHRFIANGLKHANEMLGRAVFTLDDWRVIGEFNKEAGRHQAFVTPNKDTEVEGILVKKDERVRIEESHKYSDVEVEELWRAAGVVERARWTNQNEAYAIHMVSKRRFDFPWEPEEYAPKPVPTRQEWTKLWDLWDAVTREMIPDEELKEKPIKLRNACIFYLGHIPTFFDMKLAEVTDGTHTDPQHYPKIFERGIDPDVDNPEQCHAHSEIPDDWPPLDEILTFQERVRQRVNDLYDTGAAYGPKISRGLWLGYEHEAMHLETLLYMLIQSEKTVPPPGVPHPNFDVLAKQAAEECVPNEWIKVPQQEIKIGLDDPETSEGQERYFGWDVEKPQRKTQVHAFETKARPITNGEYAEYLQNKQRTDVPASWTTTSPDKANKMTTNGHIDGANGTATSTRAYLDGKSVRTVYGAVPLEHCLDWPVSASYDELAGCAAWMGGRIPTLEETGSIYAYVDAQTRASAARKSGTQQNTIPAVNGHLSNDGVTETPPDGASTSGAGEGPAPSGPNPRDVFTSLKGANVGFAGWHPSPVTGPSASAKFSPASPSASQFQLRGQGDFGGLWEWTSTPLRAHDGYSPMPLYPAYSSDFFDGKHNIVLGGSWASVPRIAGRKSFVNWYQRNYVYVWAGARVVRDVGVDV